MTGIVVILIFTILLIICSTVLFCNAADNPENFFFSIVGSLGSIILLLLLILVLIPELENPLGVESLTEGEVVSVIAVDTTTTKYYNLMTVDSKKDVQTYGLPRELFERAPRVGNSMVLVIARDNKKIYLK